MHRRTQWSIWRNGLLRLHGVDQFLSSPSIAATVVKNICLGESTCAAEGATAPESLRQKDQTDTQRWKERVTPPPTGKALTGEALRQQRQRGSTILETP